MTSEIAFIRIRYIANRLHVNLCDLVEVLKKRIEMMGGGAVKEQVRLVKDKLADSICDAFKKLDEEKQKGGLNFIIEHQELISVLVNIHDGIASINLSTEGIDQVITLVKNLKPRTFLN